MPTLRAWARCTPGTPCPGTPCPCAAGPPCGWSPCRGRGCRCRSSTTHAPWRTTTSHRCARRDVGEATTTGTPPGPAPPAVLRVVDGLVGRLSQLPEQDRRQSGLPRVRCPGPRQLWRQQRRRGVHLCAGACPKRADRSLGGLVPGPVGPAPGAVGGGAHEWRRVPGAGLYLPPLGLWGALFTGGHGGDRSRLFLRPVRGD